MEVLDSLSSTQRETLASFQAITNTDSIDEAVVVLNEASWDLQVAIAKIYDRPSSSSRPATTAAYDDDDTGAGEARPLMHDFGIDESDVMPPSGTGRGGGGGGIFYWVKKLLSIPLNIAAWPLGIFYGVAGVALGFIARLLRIRPGLASLRPRNPFTRDPHSAAARRRLLDPTAQSERWLRSLEEVVGFRSSVVSSSGTDLGDGVAGGSGSGNGGGSGSGLRSRESLGGGRGGIPDFFVGGYEEALKKAKDELRILMVVLTCEEHDDDRDFKRNVLTDSELLRALTNEKILCWGGDIRERDAYLVSKTLYPLAYPFVSFVSLQPVSRSPNGSSSSTPRMAPLHRHEGSPLNQTSAQTILSSLSNVVIPRASPYLSRLAQQEAARQAERRIREEQDRAYERNVKADTERVLKKRREEEERIREERRRVEEEEEKGRKEEERRVLRDKMRRWREWQRLVLQKEEKTAIATGGGFRVGVRLGDGRRVVRTFAQEDTVERVYAWVECALGEPGDAKCPPLENGTPTSSPTGYEHIYEFRLATTFPRVLIEIDGTAAMEKVGAVGGGVLKGGANLVVEGLEKRRESMGELGSDEEEEEEEEVDD
ncbi:hypothetical protein T439DRAFT_304402 [Meredithblackwellia eburnea MCA 4105]